MYGQPGKKLVFMGGEFGQTTEWAHEGELDWGLLEEPGHQGLARFTAAVNRAYRETGALHDKDVMPEGFEWVIGDDRQNSVLAFLRRGRSAEDVALCVYNMTPSPHDEYRVGVPVAGEWEVRLDSDRVEFGGCGYSADQQRLATDDEEAHGRPQSLLLRLPPLGALILTPRARKRTK